MICDTAKEKIYELVYENINPTDDELMQHLADCSSCNSYYKDCQKVKNITSVLNQKQPILNNPQKLTYNILDTINNIENEEQSGGIRILTLAKRFLVAAAVCLIIVFGYEQYEVIEKLIKLETQMSAVPGIPFKSPHYQEILTYGPKLGAEFTKSELASGIFESRDNDLKSRFIMTRVGRLSPEVISKHLLNQLVHMKISNKELSVINSIKNE